MSGTAQNTFHDEPGPLTDRQECAHRGQLPQDPPPEFTQHCDQTAVFAVVHPNGLGQCMGLCPWHLARYLDAYPDRHAQLALHYEIDDYVPHTPWLELDDLPAFTHVKEEDSRYQLFALDQRGHAHYANGLDEFESMAVYADADWQHYDEYYVPPASATARDVADHIADVHGLASLPSPVVNRITGGGGHDV